MKGVIKQVFIVFLMGYPFHLDAIKLCNSSASITVPCPDGSECYCEVRNVSSGVCEGIRCSGGRPGCKCYGYCFLIPVSIVCCCLPLEPNEKLGSGKKVEFEKILRLPEKEIYVSLGTENYFSMDSLFFLFLKDPEKRLLISINFEKRSLFINLNSHRAIKENASIWLKYLHQNNQLFYLTMKSQMDTFLQLRYLNLESNWEKHIRNIANDPLLLSSPFSIFEDKIVIKNRDSIEIWSVSKNEKVRSFVLVLPENIEVKYPWQNRGYFVGATKDHIYIFFNSLPYAVVFDTLFNLINKYDLYDYKGINDILGILNEEFNKITQKNKCYRCTYSISMCFTLFPDKIIWVFGNSCFLFVNGKITKEIIFKNEEHDFLKNLKIVPFYVSPISNNQIFLNFGSNLFSIIEGGSLE